VLLLLLFRKQGDWSLPLFSSVNLKIKINPVKIKDFFSIFIIFVFRVKAFETKTTSYSINVIYKCGVAAFTERDGSPPSSFSPSLHLLRNFHGDTRVLFSKLFFGNVIPPPAFFSTGPRPLGMLAGWVWEGGGGGTNHTTPPITHLIPPSLPRGDLRNLHPHHILSLNSESAGSAMILLLELRVCVSV